jgi:hypothetical protein
VGGQFGELTLALSKDAETLSKVCRAEAVHAHRRPFLYQGCDATKLQHPFDILQH